MASSIRIAICLGLVGCAGGRQGADPGDTTQKRASLTIPSGGVTDPEGNVWRAVAIGPVQDASANYERAADGTLTFTVAAKGHGVAFAHVDLDPRRPDVVEFVGRLVTGDVEIVVRVRDAYADPLDQMQAGVMIRDGSVAIDTNPARMGAGWINPGNSTGIGCIQTPEHQISYFQSSARAAMTDAPSDTDLVLQGGTSLLTTRIKPVPGERHVWLRLQRVGKDFSFARSRDGNIWVPAGGGQFAPATAMIGVFVGAQLQVPWPPGTPRATFDQIYVGPVRSNYKTSWLGASFAQDSTDHVSLESEGIYVSPTADNKTVIKYSMAGREDHRHFDKIDGVTGRSIKLPPGNAGGDFWGVVQGGIAGDGQYLYFGVDDLQQTNGIVKRRPLATLTPDGELSSPPLGRIAGLAAGGGSVFVSDDASGRVHTLSASTLQPSGSGIAFPRPGALAVDRGGRVWIVRRPARYPSFYQFKFARVGFAIRPRLTIDDLGMRSLENCPNVDPMNSQLADCPDPLFPDGAVIECRTASGGGCGPGGSAIVIQGVGNPTALAVAPDPAFPTQDRLLIADNGPNQNIRVCTNLTAQPDCSRMFGQQGGVFAGATPGLIDDPAAPGTARFFSLSGLGVDADGNLYVASSTSKVDVRKFAPTPDGLWNGQAIWRYQGLHGFTDTGAFDPETDGRDFFSPWQHFSLDPTRVEPGKEWSAAGVTWNPFAPYPDGTRYATGNQVQIRHIGGPTGPRFMFVHGPEGSRLRVYRFVGETAVPCASITSRGTQLAVWTDGSDGSTPDGTPQASEVVSETPAPPASGGVGFDVDRRGHIWLFFQSLAIWEIAPQLPLPANGVPRYSLSSIPSNQKTTYPIGPGDPVSPFNQQSLRFDSEHDALYVAAATAVPDGVTPSSSCQQLLMGGRRTTVVRYSNWHGQRTRAYVFNLPDPQVTQSQADDTATRNSDPLCGCADWGFISWDLAGDMLFFAERQAQVHIRDARTGVEIGRLSHGPEISGWPGNWTDTPNLIGVVRRSNGEYLIANYDDANYARTILYRWTPPSSAMPGASCTGDVPCTANVPGCDAIPGISSCTGGTLGPCIAGPPECTANVPGVNCGNMPGHRSCVAGRLVGECTTGLREPAGYGDEVRDPCDGIDNDCDGYVDEDNQAPQFKLTSQVITQSGGNGTVSYSVDVRNGPQASECTTNETGALSLTWHRNVAGAWPVVGQGPSLTDNISGPLPATVYHALIATDTCAAHPVAAALYLSSAFGGTKALGQPCGKAEECQSGYCVCKGSDCWFGRVCCQSACLSPDACQPTFCSEGTGVCNRTTLPDGTACSDGNICTTGDRCQGGVCTGAGVPPPRRALGDACSTATDCASGFCADGICCESACTPTQCSAPHCVNLGVQRGVCLGGAPFPNGTACNDGSACTNVDTCQAGACVGTRTGQGSSTFCSAACPCGSGGGDCDSAAECQPGLNCVDNVGSWFGMSATTDVCVNWDPTCSTGVAASNVCCAASCGSCGGSGCSARPGGSNNCCLGDIRNAGVSCTESGPPCVLSDPQCKTGVRSGNVCCAASCGTCGGSGCGGRPGGTANCCSGSILAAGRSCATNMPPCVMP